MKYIKIIFILFIINFNLSAQSNYYVATDGDDGGAGTIGDPWATWSFGMQQLEAGDTLFIRGGLYSINTRIYINAINSNNGTALTPIVVTSYENEIPVLECDGLYRQDAFFIENRSHWHFIGLTVQNAKQDGDSANERKGFHMYLCNQIRIERCTARNNGGPGFVMNTCDTIYISNCDAYYNSDSESVVPYNGADGFQVIRYTGTFSQVYYSGCRSWNNSDDGFASAGISNVRYYNCWSVRNGYLQNGSAGMSGRGFNVGQNNAGAPSDSQYVLTNCLSAYNKSYGYHINSNSTTYMGRVKYFNNISGYNETGFVGHYGTLNLYNAEFKNNIVYPNVNKIGWLTGYQFAMENNLPYISNNNSWDAEVTITDADFVSVDSTGLKASRQSDGSLPTINFFKLASTSDLINAGADVGLDYEGAAPDLGAYEYVIPDENGTPLVSTESLSVIKSVLAIAGGNVTDDQGDAVTERGIVWNTSANPTTANNKVIVAGTTGSYTATITGLLSNTTYHVRSYAINSVGTAYGADVEFKTTKSTPLKTTKLLKVETKILVIK